MNTNKKEAGIAELVGGCMGLAIALALPIYLLSQCSSPAPTPAELEQQAAVAAQDQKLGVHCLSPWDGSQSAFVQAVKAVTCPPVVPRS